MPKHTKTSFPSLDEIFAPGGRLAQALEAYEHRPQQAEASHAIAQAFREERICMVEAGTGVGKTLAYLIPAVLAAAEGKKTVISTHTISLQTQLIEKDIPLVASLFPEVPIKAVLMKGRGNYLCHQDMDAASADLFHASDPSFRKIKTWSRKTKTGDVAELPFTYNAWFEIACNQDTCRTRDCRYFDRCFYFQMRRQAADANLFVVNHALYLCDLELRAAEADACILPDYDYVVFDEAHRLEEVATGVFGVEVQNRSLPRFVERVRRLKDLDISQARLDSLLHMNTALFDPFNEGKYEFFFKDVLSEEGDAMTRGAAEQLCTSLGELSNELIKLSKEEEPPLSEKLEGMAHTAARMQEEVHLLIFGTDPDYIHWGEVASPPADKVRARDAGPRTTLHYTPVSVGKRLEEMLWNNVRSAVLTSATLSNSGGFSYLSSRLNIPEGAIEKVVGSPFDFKRQALLYVPGHLPEPPKAPVPAYTDRVAQEIERVVELSEGRAFLLFTSYRMMNEIYARLSEKLPYPLFRQGEMPPGKLLDAFKESGNGVLFGTQTFWEGVDVQGDALSCVIIDRLPFAVPDSPLNRARTDAITAEGGDWFRDFSIPQAQIRLKQGFGRLIRTKTDRGIVCILDTRLITRPYGQEFVRHLPPAARASLWPRVLKVWKAGKVEDGVSAVVEQPSAAEATAAP